MDKTDLDLVVDLKSNKTDTDLVMKGLDIVHKQVTHAVVLIIELIKLNINQMSLQSDSEKSKHHKSMMYILQQAVNVCRWVNEFDPQNINIEDLYLPNDLK